MHLVATKKISKNYYFIPVIIKVPPQFFFTPECQLEISLKPTSEKNVFHSDSENSDIMEIPHSSGQE